MELREAAKKSEGVQNRRLLAERFIPLPQFFIATLIHFLRLNQHKNLFIVLLASYFHVVFKFFKKDDA